MRWVAALLGMVFAVAAAQAGPVFRDCDRCPEMVVLPGADFAMSRTAVTFDDWQACVEAKACRGGQDDHGWGRGRRPVINVTWADAAGYARWLSTLTGKAYALPDEAQWEIAARAGTTTAYWWGDEPGGGHANCRECGSRWDGVSTAPVASFPPNPFGLYDMNGNVWSWTADCWVAGEAEPCRNRAIRGGSWYYYPQMAKPTARARGEAGQWSYNIGLRVVRRMDGP